MLMSEKELAPVVAGETLCECLAVPVKRHGYRICDSVGVRLFR
jgi:hypothetical protein